MAIGSDPLPMPHNEETAARAEKEICREIKAVEADLRSRHPWLRYQDTLGALGMIVSVLGVAAGYWLHLSDENNMGRCIVAVLTIVFFTSILHEMEHDLIHSLYFSRIPFLKDLSFFIIWVSKLNANPWWRKTMHLKHHIFSGQTCDAEERLIGLGMPFGIMRMIVTMHPFGAMLITAGIRRDSSYFNLDQMIRWSAVPATINIIMNKLLLAYVVAIYVYGDSYSAHLPFLPHWLYWWIKKFHLLSFLPNCIRQSSIVLMSTLSHYYGDIPTKSVFYQNQVLDHWALIPFQFCCFNFGATHIVHHYVPNQPFYLRQMVYSSGVREFMIALGVRHNDLGIVARSNNFFYESQNNSKNESFAMSIFGFILFCSTFGVVLFPIYDVYVIYSLTVMRVKRYFFKASDAVIRSKLE